MVAGVVGVVAATAAASMAGFLTAPAARLAKIDDAVLLFCNPMMGEAAVEVEREKRAAAAVVGFI